jgi:hypothetical protein
MWSDPSKGIDAIEYSRAFVPGGVSTAMSPARQFILVASNGFSSMWKQGCPALPGLRSLRFAICQRSLRGPLHPGAFALRLSAPMCRCQ